MTVKGWVADEQAASETTGRAKTNARLVYVTVGTHSEALSIGRSVVEARLAACANVIDRVKSIYWWGGDIQESDEVVLLVKSQANLIDALIDNDIIIKNRIFFIN